MTSFFILAALMLALALAFLLVPLFRGINARSAAPSEEASNLALLRARKHEIENDFAQGNLRADERDAAIIELTDRVAEEIPARPAPTIAISPKRPWLLGLGATLAIVLVTALTYTKVGNFTALTMGDMAATPPAAASASAALPQEAPPSDKQILALVDALAQKMEANPTDPKGWLLLARSQNALGRHTEAAQAYERALSLIPTRTAAEAPILADYADALVMVQQGKFEGKPMAMIVEALKLDPNHAKSLALAGTAEMRAGRREASLKHWKKLKSVLPAESEDAREVDAIIAEVTGEAAKPAPVVASAPIAVPPTQVEKAAASTGARVSGAINVAPEIMAKIESGDTLFVFARAVNGPKMPLAILRIPVPTKWPHVYALTDAMAMAPEFKLSSFPEVQIEARISKSGGAMPTSGDLGGKSAAIKPSATDINVTISQVVP